LAGICLAVRKDCSKDSSAWLRILSPAGVGGFSLSLIFYRRIIIPEKQVISKSPAG
jgi:hypothetical protein